MQRFFSSILLLLFTSQTIAADWGNISWKIDQKKYKEIISNYQKEFPSASAFEAELLGRAKSTGQNLSTGLARLPKILWQKGNAEKCSKEKYIKGVACFREIAKKYEAETQKVIDAITSGIMTNESDFPKLDPTVAEILLRSCGPIPKTNKWEVADSHSQCVANAADNLRIRAHNSSAALSRAQKGLMEISLISEACEKSQFSDSACMPNTAQESVKQGVTSGLTSSNKTNFDFLKRKGDFSGGGNGEGDALQQEILESEENVVELTDPASSNKGMSDNDGTPGGKGNNLTGKESASGKNRIGWTDPLASPIEEKKAPGCDDTVNSAIELGGPTCPNAISLEKAMDNASTQFASTSIEISKKCETNFSDLENQQLDAASYMLETQIMSYVDRMNRVKGQSDEFFKRSMKNLLAVCPQPARENNECDNKQKAQTRSHLFVKEMHDYALSTHKHNKENHEKLLKASLIAVDDLKAIDNALHQVLFNFPPPTGSVAELVPEFLPCHSIVGALDDIKKIWKSSHFKSRCPPLDVSENQKIWAEEEKAYQACKMADYGRGGEFDYKKCETSYINRIKDDFEKDIRKGRAFWQKSKTNEELEKELEAVETVSFFLVTGLESPSGKTVISPGLINGLESRELECKKKAQVAKKLIAQKFALLAQHPELLAETFEDGKKPDEKWKYWSKHCKSPPPLRGSRQYQSYKSRCPDEKRPDNWDPKRETRPLHERLSGNSENNTKLVLAQMDEKEVEEELRSLAEGISSICKDPISAGSEVLIDNQLYQQYASCANNLPSDQKVGLIGANPSDEQYDFWDRYNNRSQQKSICQKRIQLSNSRCDVVSQIVEGTPWARQKQLGRSFAENVGGPIMSGLDVAGCAAMFTGIGGALYSGGKAALASGVRAGAVAAGRSLTGQSANAVKAIIKTPAGAVLGGGGGIGGYAYAVQLENEARANYEKLKRRAGVNPQQLADAKNTLEDAERGTNIGYFLLGFLIPGGDGPHTAKVGKQALHELHPPSRKIKQIDESEAITLVRKSHNEEMIDLTDQIEDIPESLTAQAAPPGPTGEVILTQSADPVRNVASSYSSDRLLLITEVKEDQITAQIKNPRPNEYGTPAQVEEIFSKTNQIKPARSMDDPNFVGIGERNLYAPQEQRIYAPSDPAAIGYKYQSPEQMPLINYLQDYHGLENVQLHAFEFENVDGKLRLTKQSQADAKTRLTKILGDKVKDMDIEYINQGGLNAIFKMCPKPQGKCLVSKMPLIDKAIIRAIAQAKESVQILQNSISKNKAKLQNPNLPSHTRGQVEADLAKMERRLATETASLKHEMDKLTDQLSAYRADLAFIKWAQDSLASGKGPTLNGKEFLSHGDIPPEFNNLETLSHGVVVQEYIGVEIPKKIPKLPAPDEITLFRKNRKFPDGSPEHQLLTKYGDPYKMDPEIGPVYEFVHLCSQATTRAIKSYCKAIIKANNYPSASNLRNMISGAMQWQLDTQATVMKSAGSQLQVGRDNPVYYRRDPSSSDGKKIVRHMIGFDGQGGRNLVWDPTSRTVRYIDR